MNRLFAWLQQYPVEAHSGLVRLLDKVIYYSEQEIVKTLVALNNQLLENITNAQIPRRNIYYVQIGDAGSSSQYILHLLRDAARLVPSGYKLIDWRDLNTERGPKLSPGSDEIALIYVDDYAGTGDQFLRFREYFEQGIIFTNVSEFFLAPSICEEAYSSISEAGVKPICEKIHTKADRPLLHGCKHMDQETREMLMMLCKTSDFKHPLGYKNLASMVVNFRNAPNSLPLLLRGHTKQTPLWGILPRTTDLPPLPTSIKDSGKVKSLQR